MKQTFILTMVASFVMATVFTSCHPSRVWVTKKKEPREYREREVYTRPVPPPPPPPVYNRVALVVNPYPGFVMRQSPDGRYYHRSQQGYTYWKGYDNRFYLDKRDMRNVSYSRGEYEEWRRGTP
jgi:hypothetical protein